MNRLPNEIILDIFEDLSYSDLRWNVPYVCRRFRALLHPNETVSLTSKLDKILFRDLPIQHPPTISIPCDVHPCFSQLYYDYTPDIADVKAYNPHTKKFQELIHSPLRNESACSPAAFRVNVAIYVVTSGFGFGPSAYMEGSGKEGALTVLDVMKAVVLGVNTVWHMDGLDLLGWGGFARDAEIIDGELKLKAIFVGFE